MNGPRAWPLADPRDVLPHQRIAAAVIKQAIADAVTGRRSDARAFIATHYFTLWCQVAGLDAGAVRTTIARMLSEPPPRGVVQVLNQPLYVRV